jgi:hypothetical protein
MCRPFVSEQFLIGSDNVRVPWYFPVTVKVVVGPPFEGDFAALAIPPPTAPRKTAPTKSAAPVIRILGCTRLPLALYNMASSEPVVTGD